MKIKYVQWNDYRQYSTITSGGCFTKPLTRDSQIKRHFKARSSTRYLTTNSIEKINSTSSNMQTERKMQGNDRIMYILKRFSVFPGRASGSPCPITVAPNLPVLVKFS